MIAVIKTKINTFFIVNLFQMQDINKNSLTVICENTVNSSEEFQSSSELLVQK